MIKREIPRFIIKKNLQKSKVTGRDFTEVATNEVLTDICIRLTNCDKYTVNFVENDYTDEFYQHKMYNVGRLAILLYKDEVNYISFSEYEIDGRNSSVQSVIPAFNMFYNSKAKNKRLHYYFLQGEGNLETNYHSFSYRLMKTIGFNFLNEEEILSNDIIPFNSIDDIIYARNNNKNKNKSNNSTYVDKSDRTTVNIYGKTYGANKYESAMICYAISIVASKRQNVTVYEVEEQDLQQLPETSKQVINDMGVIDIIPTDMKLEKRVFNEGNSLRSPHYIYNLFEKFGDKKCAFCDCNIPESIQGAHIWPVAYIKKDNSISFEKKLEYAIDGENGLWLCDSHHKLFDKDKIRISLTGDILINDTIDNDQKEFIRKITTVTSIPEEYITESFTKYIKKRYNL